jgi:hypothetical protein
LLDLRGKCREAIKKNALLEAAVHKGRKRRNLTSNDLAMAAKEDTIRALGRKYSITHCLWINIELFPLSARTCPDIDLNSKERWLTGVSMEDGVRAELFKFIPEEERELMSYQNFGSQVCLSIGTFQLFNDNQCNSLVGASATLVPKWHPMSSHAQVQSLVPTRASSYEATNEMKTLTVALFY